MKELGIYIHIPFCAKKCAYCDFVSFEKKEEYINKYIKSLKTEIDKCEELKTSEYNINTIYIGGGTPSFVDSKYILEIMNLIKEKCNLSSTEITIEVNPGTATKQKLEDYYNSGINRISIGLQTTNDELLKTIGRIHKYEEFLQAYQLARTVRF